MNMQLAVTNVRLAAMNVRLAVLPVEAAGDVLGATDRAAAVDVGARGVDDHPIPRSSHAEPPARSS
jgi:hypothetical protein